jgi:hypothetical protein
MVFILESSYGADIIAVCDDADVQIGEIALKSPG